jgi:diaminopimelate decarboxylase
MEPGQELVTPVEAIVASVIEVRQRRDTREIVLDAGLPAIPEARMHAHRVFFGAPKWLELGAGTDRIVGNICMEDDVICTGTKLPEHIREGDLIAVADTGAYDSSMVFDFAQGRPRPEEP